MAGFRLTDDQLDHTRRVREIASTTISPLAAAGAAGRVNRLMVRALGDTGLLRGLFGGEPGELPRDAAALSLCLLRESIAQVSGEAETALALQGLGSYPILQSGSREQIER